MIFDGLTQDYENLILSVDTRKESYTVDEIEALLLAQEARIEKRTTTHISMDNHVANFTQFSGRTQRFNNGGRAQNFSSDYNHSMNSQTRDSKDEVISVVLVAEVVVLVEESTIGIAINHNAKCVVDLDIRP